MTEGSWRRIAATPLAIGLDLIERCRSSHRRAVRTVERSRASTMARARLYVSVLRERFARGG